MNVQQLVHLTKQLALKVPPLVREHLKWITKTREKNSFTAARAVISAVWEGKGIHSTHLVN